MTALKYEFKNQGLLQLALTQSGVDAKKNNERLEFIGDRVLGLAVAEMLYKMYPEETEGELARRHAKLVSTHVLGNLAREHGLDKMVRHGHMTGGRNIHMLANTMEAVLGAVYIDGGFNAARDIIVGIWEDLAKRDVIAPKDPKSMLQEYVQNTTTAHCLNTNFWVQQANHTRLYLQCLLQQWERQQPQMVVLKKLRVLRRQKNC